MKMKTNSLIKDFEKFRSEHFCAPDLENSWWQRQVVKFSDQHASYSLIYNQQKKQKKTLADLTKKRLCTKQLSTQSTNNEYIHIPHKKLHLCHYAEKWWRLKAWWWIQMAKITVHSEVQAILSLATTDIWKSRKQRRRTRSATSKIIQNWSKLFNQMSADQPRHQVFLCRLSGHCASVARVPPVDHEASDKHRPSALRKIDETANSQATNKQTHKRTRLTGCCTLHDCCTWLQSLAYSPFPHPVWKLHHSCHRISGTLSAWHGPRIQHSQSWTRQKTNSSGSC